MLLVREDTCCSCSPCPLRHPPASAGLGAGSPLWERTGPGPRNSRAWTEITLASAKDMEN